MGPLKDVVSRKSLSHSGRLLEEMKIVLIEPSVFLKGVYKKARLVLPLTLDSGLTM
jgi:hypothetical protein